jgi:hypothetical protein
MKANSTPAHAEGNPARNPEVCPRFTGLTHPSNGFSLYPFGFYPLRIPAQSESSQFVIHLISQEFVMQRTLLFGGMLILVITGCPSFPKKSESEGAFHTGQFRIYFPAQR